MDKNDIKGIVNDEISKFIKDSLDTEVRKVLHNSNSKSRDELIKTIKDAMEMIFKTLWVKKDFWKTGIN